MPTFDLVLTGGTLVDGTGRPGRPADIAVAGERIVAVTAPGVLADHGAGGRIGQVVQATGHVVCPGFVDLHSHADFTVEATPGAESCLAQGVTTLLTGNCGYSPFPVAPDTHGGRSALLRSTATLDGGLRWTWHDLAGYAAAVQARRPAINIAPQVGHGALRLATVGPERRPPGPHELDRMRALLAEAAEQGAYGLSTGLVYAPGSYAAADEVTALCAVAARHDLLYSTHVRDERERLLDAVAEALDAARTTGVRLEISHLKSMGRANHGTVLRALDLIDAARGDGVTVGADVYPYTASGTTLTARLPDWALDGGAAALLDRLADRATRRRIADDLRERIRPDAPGVVFAALPPGRFGGYVGRSLADVAADLGTDPADAALEVLAAHRASVGIVNHAMADSDVEAVLTHPGVAVASDGHVLAARGSGMPHPRNFGTFARVLGHYVRDRGLLDLPGAVHRMTGLPAARLGLRDRGLLREGFVADIAVVDPATVADRSAYADPWQLATGVRDVFVAGVHAWHGGAPTGARAGRVLLRGVAD